MCISIGRIWGKRKVEQVMPWPHMPQLESPICPCHASQGRQQEGQDLPSCCNSRICNKEIYWLCTWVYTALIYLKRAQVSPCPCAVMQRCVLHSLCYSQWCGSVLMPREVIVAPSSWSSGIAQLLGEEKCLACNSAVLGPHHKHAGSWTSLTAASPLSQQCPWVSWLQGRSSPLTPASPCCLSLVRLPPRTNFFSCVNASFLCHWCLLCSYLSIGVTYSRCHLTVLPLSFPYTRYNQSWMPFMPFPPLDQTCSICLVSSVLLPDLQLLPLQCTDFLATETLSILPFCTHSSLWKFVLCFPAFSIESSYLFEWNFLPFGLKFPIHWWLN